MDYKKQQKEIEKLLKSISEKTKKYVENSKPEYPYFQDLQTVLKDLKEIDGFLP